MNALFGGAGKWRDGARIVSATKSTESERNDAPAQTNQGLFVFVLVLILVLDPFRLRAQSFPDSVTTFTAGAGAGFGQSFFPGNVLGPPNGNSNPATPNFDEHDLLSLGNGGSIILHFTSSIVVDGPGYDIAVFENPVQPQDTPTQSFSETAIVSVSDNGTSWTTFPFNFIPPGPSGSLLDKQNYIGFAGVNPVLSSPSNGISPFNPAVSGGDFFDLAQVGLSRARYVRITDTGTTGPTQTVDPDGDIVDDPGKHFQFSGSVGFDLDAVAAIHSIPATTAVRRDWQLYE